MEATRFAQENGVCIYGVVCVCVCKQMCVHTCQRILHFMSLFTDFSKLWYHS